MSTYAFIVCVLAGACLGFKLEQSCSKFHYEEQTLEKLIRLQLFVEKTKEEMDEIKNTVIEMLYKLSEERKRQEKDLQDAIGGFAQVKNSVEREITKFSKEKEQSESTTTPVVAFSAHTVRDKSLSDDKVLVFTGNLFDIDGSYDNRTGIFTVPTDGVYIFTAQICLPSHAIRASYFTIRVGGNNVQSALLGDVDYYKCYTMNAVVTATKGTEVTVRCKTLCSGKILLDNSSMTTTFSGVLIR